MAVRKTGCSPIFRWLCHGYPQPVLGARALLRCAAGTLLAIVANACGSAAVADGVARPAFDAGSPDAGPPEVGIGVPGGANGLDFADFPAGGALRLQSFGQGGTHVLLAVRCVGFGSRAFVGITLTNLLTGDQVVSPPPVRPQLLQCRDERVCDLVPILAMATGIAAPNVDRNGLHIDITVAVRNEDGAEASASKDAVLSTADL